MKRVQAESEEQAVKRQRLDQLTQLGQLVVEYSNRILKETDELQEARLKSKLATVKAELAKVEVQMAQEAFELAETLGDAQKRIDANLALFKAEKGLAKAEQEKIIAEAKAEAAATTDDSERTYWKRKVISADTSLEAILNELSPNMIAEKTEALRARFFPLEKPLTSIEFDEFDKWLSKHPITPQVSAYHGAVHSEIQCTLLGNFHKDGELWPITGGPGQLKLDLELLPSLLEDNAKRPAADALLDQLEKEQRYILMLAVSGGGKTSAFADVARKHYVMYIQCTPWESQEDARRSKGYDHGYVALVDILRQVIGKNMQENANEARRLFVLEIVCRLAQLYRLIKSKPDLTSFEYYVHQRNMGDSWIETVRNRFAKLTLETMKRLVSSMYESLVEHLGKSRLVIAVDEIEAAAKELFNKFDEDKAKNKGFLSPMISGLTQLEPNASFKVIFTGTASGLQRVDTVASPLNKKSDLATMTAIPEKFPTVTVRACRTLFNKLNIDDICLDWTLITGTREFDREFTIERIDSLNVRLELVLDYFIIGSRFRTLTRIVQNIVGLRKKECSSNEKRYILRLAVIESLKKFRADICRQFEKVGFSREEHQSVKDMYMEYFTTIWASMCLNGGRAFIPRSTAKMDLMRLGVGNFEESSEDGYYIVTEFLVADSIREFLEGRTAEVPGSAFRRALAAFERVVQVHKSSPARGTILEEVVFRALCKPDFQGKMVSDLPFVHPFEMTRRKAETERNDAIVAAQSRSRSTRYQAAMAAEPIIVLDPWWTRTAFHANGTLFSHQLRAGETTSSFLASSEARGMVYSPETVARPDGVVMLDEGHAIVLGITIWNGMVPSGKVHSQIRSTDLSKTYFTADGGEVNPSCKPQRQDWESRGLHQVRAVRVHLALPSFVQLAPEGEPVKEEDLGVHLDRTNCHLLFGQDETASALYDVLAIATSTRREDWP